MSQKPTKEEDDFVNQCTSAARQLINDRAELGGYNSRWVARFVYASVSGEDGESLFKEIKMASTQTVEELEAENAQLRAELARLKKKKSGKEAK